MGRGRGWHGENSAWETPPPPWRRTPSRSASRTRPPNSKGKKATQYMSCPLCPVVVGRTAVELASLA
eukprot:3863734-Pyramimonas_sp.AAC.1